MALEDRDYMRAGFKMPRSRPTVSVVTVLLAVNVAVFVLQLATAERMSFNVIEGGVTTWFSVGLEDLRGFQLWRLITHMFVHANAAHLVVNMVALWFMGRAVERMLGARHFLAVYFLSGVLGALLWLPTRLFISRELLAQMLAQGTPPVLVGASGAILGLIGAAVALNPNAMVYLFLVLPMRLKTFAIGFLVLSVLFVVLGILPGIAHLAHVGGLAGGWLYARYLLPAGRGRGRSPLAAFKRWWGRLLGGGSPGPLKNAKDSPSASDLGLRFVDDDKEPDGESDPLSQVDPILDKISRHGMKSLTRRELEILDRAKDKLRNERP